MTLRTKVALILVGAIFGLLAVAALLRAFDRQRTLMAERTREGVLLGQTLADLIARSHQPLGSAHVQGLVQEYGHAANVAGVRIVDRTFTIVAASRPEETGRSYRDPTIMEAVRHGVLTPEVRRTRIPVLSVAVPIRVDGRLAGALELRLDLRSVRTDLVSFLREGALPAALAAAVTSLLLMWALTLVVVRPVTQYARLTQEMARGEFGVEIPARGADEIGQLGRALQRTRDSLRELSVLWKDQNPLTGLPGNRAIERELRRRLEAGAPFVVLYADLDLFKAFNDQYGFDRGDEVIRFAAAALQGAVTAAGEGGFVGHVGGDDFILAVRLEQAEPVAREAIRLFDRDIAGYYAPEDRERGAIEAADRQGRPVRVPIAGLTIVGVPAMPGVATPVTIGETAADLKRYAKASSSGSKFMMDRRGARLPAS